MQTIKEAMSALNAAWPSIKSECLSVLGSELHYQAMIYHCLRQYGDVPIDQLGMNVKMTVYDPISPLFKELTEKRHQDFSSIFFASSCESFFESIYHSYQGCAPLFAGPKTSFWNQIITVIKGVRTYTRVSKTISWNHIPQLDNNF